MISSLTYKIENTNIKIHNIKYEHNTRKFGLEQIEDIGNITFSEVKETLESGLSIRIDDCIDNNVSEWF